MDYAIFLDDTRNAPTSKGVLPDDVVICRSFDEFTRTIKKYGCPRFISFDHDLGPVGEQPSGLDCAKWLIEWVLDDTTRLPEDFSYAVHSMNPAGAANIRGLMSGFLSCFKLGQYGTIRSFIADGE